MTASLASRFVSKTAHSVARILSPASTSSAGVLQLSQAFRTPLGEFLMKINASPGQTVEVQTSRDFRHWDMMESMKCKRAEIIYADVKASAASVRFYRVSAEGQT